MPLLQAFLLMFYKSFTIILHSFLFSGADRFSFVFFLFNKHFIKLLSSFYVCFVFVLFSFYLYLIIFYFYVIITKQRYNFSFCFICIMFYFNLCLIKVWLLFDVYKINFLSNVDLYLLLSEHNIIFTKAKFLFYINFYFVLFL